MSIIYKFYKIYYKLVFKNKNFRLGIAFFNLQKYLF